MGVGGLIEIWGLVVRARVWGGVTITTGGALHRSKGARATGAVKT